MSDSVYSFRSAPTYRASTREAMLAAAFDRPMNVGSTFFDQAKGGILESFGLGTGIREMMTPGGEVTTDGTVRSAARLLNPVTTAYEATRLAVDALRDDSPALDEDAYKASRYFRTEVPWDGAMTEDRAASLADWHDRRKVRQFYAEKRPVTSFIGNLSGQALDPINYIPVAGPLVKAAAVARAGRIGGAALAGAVDAAGNTALAGLATRDARSRFGDDVSWQATVSEIATAALIGMAFGSLGGAWEARTDARAKVRAQERLTTLRTTQESRVALNEAIDAVVHGEDVALSPNATEPMMRVEREADRVSIPKGDAPDDLLVKDAEIVSDDGLLREAVKDHFAAFVEAERKFTEAGGDMDAPYEIRQAFRDAEDQLVEDFRIVGLPGDSVGNVTAVNSADDIKNAFNRATPEQRENFWLKSGDQPSPPVASDAPKLLPHDISLNRTASWVIREKATGKAVMETFDPTLVGKVNTAKYEAVPIGQYLGEINGQKKVGLDNSPPRPDPIPEGRAQAETKIGKPDDYKAMAAQYGVHPETGAFAEEAEIAQLKAEGRLTADDTAILDDAKRALDDGEAYGEALKAAVGCLI